jgi:outer membrane lipoprotein LolB
MAFLAASLVSCAGVEPQPVPKIIPALRTGMPPERFELRGRISVKTADESYTGGFRWKHVKSVDEVWLYTPLGQGMAKLRSDPLGVSLTTSDKHHFEASEVEQLTEQRLGWRLPLRGLVWWANAMPHPDTTATASYESKGRLASLNQDGWQLKFLQYQAEPAHLPRKLAMSRDDLEIRLVFDEWRVND